MWEKLFYLETTDFNWENIYFSKIKQMYENNIAEFNYKLLHCIVNNNLAVSKWNENVSPLCDVCKLVEDAHHLLFSCEMVNKIWKRVGTFLHLTITWKTIVLGFYKENNIHTVMLNNLISFVCFTIYKYKMKCRFDNEIMSERNLIQKLKYNLCLQNDILKHAKKFRSNNNMFTNLGNYLLMNILNI